MKKIALLLICIAMCCSIVACGDIAKTPSYSGGTTALNPVFDDKASDFAFLDRWDNPLDRKVEINGRKGIMFALGRIDHNKDFLQNEGNCYQFYLMRNTDTPSERIDLIRPLYCEKSHAEIKTLEESRKLDLPISLPAGIYYDDYKLPIYVFYIPESEIPKK